MQLLVVGLKQRMPWGQGAEQRFHGRSAYLAVVCVPVPKKAPAHVCCMAQGGPSQDHPDGIKCKEPHKGLFRGEGDKREENEVQLGLWSHSCIVAKDGKDNT